MARPPVDPRFYAMLEKTEARRLLGLSPKIPVVLLSGGGWGAGDFRGALLAALALPEAHVICLCGHNQRLKMELETLAPNLGVATSRVSVLGFSEQMNELLAAADVLIHSTGGVTCLEAAVRRCPVIVYGAPQGHPRRVARSMAKLNEAMVARSSKELPYLLQEVMSGRGVRGEDTQKYPAAGEIILAARPRAHPRRTRLPWRILPGAGDGGEPRDKADEENGLLLPREA